jgi:hypothetical protein
MYRYSHLSYEYYYLDELDKSRYYLDRYMRGIVEEDDSVVKQIYLQEDKIHSKKYYVRPNTDIETLKEDPQIRSLPSPREGRHKISQDTISRNYSDLYQNNTNKIINQLFNGISSKPQTAMTSKPRAQEFSKAKRAMLSQSQFSLDKHKKFLRKANDNIYCSKPSEYSQRSFHDIVHYCSQKNYDKHP